MAHGSLSLTLREGITGFGKNKFCKYFEILIMCVCRSTITVGVGGACSNEGRSKDCSGGGLEACLVSSSTSAAG